MGHYDSCYEADRNCELDRLGKSVREKVNKMSDRELGVLSEKVQELFGSKYSLVGTYNQTSQWMTLINEIYAKLVYGR